MNPSYVPAPALRRLPSHARALALVAWAVSWTACGTGARPLPSRPACRPCPAAPAATPAPPVAPLGLLGTADFLEVQTASPEADWAVICQARADTNGDGEVSMHSDHWGALYGDRPIPYFIQGAGPGEPLDAYVLRDATGRHLLVVKDGKLLLLDTRAQVATDLTARGAPKGADGYPFLGHAGASFDANGARLLYLQGPRDRRVAVVRDLATSAEVRVPPPPRRLLYAYLHRGGRWVLSHSELAPEHRCHFSRSEQPFGARRFCPGRDAELHVLSRDLHPCTDLWVSPADGGAPPREADDVVFLADDALVIRDAAGALRLVRGTQDRVLVPAACRGRVLGAAESPLALLVACVGPRPNVKFVTDAGAQALPLTVEVPEKDNEWISPHRLQRVDTREGSVYVDLDGRPPRLLREPGNLVARHGRRALFHGQKQLRLYDLATGHRVLAVQNVPEYPHVFTAGAQVAVGRSGDWPGVGIDLDAGRVTGRLPREVYALSRQGFALVEAAGQGLMRASGHVRGPLMWLAPVPADTPPGDEPPHRYFWIAPLNRPAAPGPEIGVR